jgi:hypothetical protein
MLLYYSLDKALTFYGKILLLALVKSSLYLSFLPNIKEDIWTITLKGLSFYTAPHLLWKLKKSVFYIIYLAKQKNITYDYQS